MSQCAITSLFSKLCADGNGESKRADWKFYPGVDRDIQLAQIEFGGLLEYIISLVE